MAEPLSQLGHNRLNVDQGKFLAFVGRYEDFEQRLADAQETVRSIRKGKRDLLKEIEASGIPREAFDRAIEDAKEPGAVREMRDEWHRRMLAWMRKPIGTQGALDLGDVSLEPTVAELKEVDNDGVFAGKSGHRRDSNPWSPGTEQYQRWDNAWMRGQAEIAQSMAPNGHADGAEPESIGGDGENGVLAQPEAGEKPPRGRRPRMPSVPGAEPRRRGRPRRVQQPEAEQPAAE